MIKLMMAWFRMICSVPEDKFRIKIQCYGPDMAVEAKRFWQRVTGIPLIQFVKPYVRATPASQCKMGDISPYGAWHKNF